MDTVDRISHLPPNITEHILQFVTLKDAVRTSILSTRWRYQWTFSAKLVLDRPFFLSVMKKFRNDEESLKRDGSLDSLLFKFSNIVNNILFRHNGPIHKFVLHIPCWFPHQVDISHWIHFLSAKSVKQFTSVNLSNDRKLPSWFLSSVGFTHLTHLTLIQWIVPSLSATFSGFPFLVTLKLHRSIENDSGVAKTIGILVSKCPLLKTLDLNIYDKEGWLDINARKLQKLFIKGRLFGIFFSKETKRINTLSLLCELDEDMKLFGCFPLMKELVLGNDICMVFDTRIVGNCCFGHLKSAHICVGIVGISLSYEIGLELIKKILSLSPVLEVMTIQLRMKDEEKLNFAKKLLRFHRASTSAEIIFNT